MARPIDKDYLLKHKRKVRFFGIGPDDESWGYAVPAEVIENAPTLTSPNEALAPYPDGDMSIIACPRCGSGEYLHNEDGNEQNYCGQCGQAIDWSHPPEGEVDGK